jgi:hypothetical protein
VLALAAGRSAAEAAAACGVGERTVRTWLADPAFVARVQAIRGELSALAVGRLADLSGKAADALGRLLDEPSPMARLGAARAILEAGPWLREQDELAAKLAALEAKLADVQNGRQRTT